MLKFLFYLQTTEEVMLQFFDLIELLKSCEGIWIVLCNLDELVLW